MTATSSGENPPNAVSGARVVLAIIGALAALVAIVIIGFTLFEPEAAPCASGEDATNPLVDGRFEARTESFTTVRDAEAFICHSVPEVQAEGWALEHIVAERTVPIEFLVEGDGLGLVTLGYLEDASGRALTIDASPNFGESYFASQIPELSSEEPVTIGERPGTAYRFGINPDQVTVIWVDESLEHRAVTQLSPEFQLPELIGVLESLD